jgi:predicted nucleic acid-binding protein
VKYLLDTNVLSELRKTNCNPKVRTFTDNIPLTNLFISAMSIGEIIVGIEKLPAGKKRTELSLWLNANLLPHFDPRFFSMDSGVMLEWGRLFANSKRTLPLKDSFIAACAMANHLTLVKIGRAHV